MYAKLTEKCFKGMSGAYAALFTPYDEKGRVNPEMIGKIVDYGIKYTGRDYYAAQCLKRKLGKETIWFAGCDEQLLCGLALGNVFSGGIGTTYNIIPRHFAKICELAAKGDFRSAAKWQDEANQVVELMIESDNWSYRKAMMTFIGLDCGAYRKPFEPLTPAQYKAYAKRFAKLGIAKAGQAGA